MTRSLFADMFSLKRVVTSVEDNERGLGNAPTRAPLVKRSSEWEMSLGDERILGGDSLRYRPAWLHRSNFFQQP